MIDQIKAEGLDDAPAVLIQAPTYHIDRETRYDDDDLRPEFVKKDDSGWLRLKH